MAGRWGAPIKTGKVLGVQVPDEEGRANRRGSKSCAGDGNGVREALTGECIGPVGRPEISVQLPGADVVPTHGRPHCSDRSGKAEQTRRGRRPGACTHASCAGIGRVRVCPSGERTGGPPQEVERTYAADAQTPAVGWSHRTGDHPKPSGTNRSGGLGGKATSQRDGIRAPHAPDAGPD
jgi:hypothetical protein